MISMYDLSPYDFLLLCMHVISAMLYVALGIKIVQLKKYLKWNAHIYPRMMIASFGIAIVFLSEIVARNTYNIFFHLFMWLFAFNQFAELFRLVEKYNKIEELQKKIQMKSLITILILASLFFTGCGSRKAEMEKMRKENTEKTSGYEKEISDLKTKITEKTQSETEKKKEIESKKTQIEKLHTENKQLIEKLNEHKKDDISIKNANGMVTVTDANGNTYQIPSIAGTEITKKSESILSKELNSVTETLNRTQETNEFLNKVISERDKSITEKETEIKAYTELIKKHEATIKSLETEKKKNTERKSYPVYWWVILGAILMGIVQLAWKVYKPKFPKL